MEIKDCFQLGKITKPFGYKGDVVFFLDVDEPMDYAEMDSVFVEIGGKLLPYFIESINIKGNKAIVRFEDLTADEAMKLIGKNLYLPLSLLPKLTGKKFYFHEIINFAVVDAKRGNIGNVASVIDYPAQPLFQIMNGDTEILIPILDQIIEKVDRENKTIYIVAPEGLIDIYLQ